MKRCYVSENQASRRAGRASACSSLTPGQRAKIAKWGNRFCPSAFWFLAVSCVQFGAEEPTLFGSFTGLNERVTSITIAAANRTLASGSDDGTLKLWDLDSGRLRFTLKGHKKNVCAVAFSPDTKMLATSSLDGTVKLWDADVGTELESSPDLGGAVTTLVFSPDGKLLAAEDPVLQAVKLWDVAKRQIRAVLQGPLPARGGMAFSPDGKALAAMGPTPSLWDAATGEVLRSLQTGHYIGFEPRCWAFSPDGKTVAAGTWQSSVGVWDVQTGAERALFRHRYIVRSIAFRPDGKTLLLSCVYGSTGSAPEVAVWDVQSRQKLRTFRPDRSKVSLIKGSFAAEALSSDGKLWATACTDNTIKVWKLCDD